MGANHRTPRQFLANEIKRGREQLGLTQAELAKQIYASDSLVRAWESARRIPKPDHLNLLDELYGTSGILARIREEMVTAAVPLEWFRKWPEIEHQAGSLWSFHPLVFPGLLQTEDYARAVLQAANHTADIDEMIAVRMDRQQVLDKEDPPMLVALIAESALRYNVGGHKVMHDQLLHLAELTRRDNVIIHIIPNNAPICAGFAGSFVIASYDGGDDIAHVDNQLSGEVIEDSEGVARLHRLFDIFRSHALPAPASLELILRTAAEWNT